MSELLSSLLVAAPFIQRAFLLDCMVGVTDREKFLAYYPATKLDLDIKAGDRLREGSINLTAIQLKTQVIRKIPKEIYGIPYIAVGCPIVEAGQVVGCLSTGVTTDQEERLVEMAEQVSTVLENIAQHTESLARDAEYMMQASHTLSEAAERMENKIAETSQISHLIKNISSRSNILGLNAMLESARAGAAGRGFAVVANEIRQLSQTTSASAKDIFQILDEMNQLVRIVAVEMERTMRHSTQQSTRIQELSAIMQQLRRMSEDLKDASQLNKHVNG